jgi:TusA-related sulfurtransferase
MNCPQPQTRLIRELEQPHAGRGRELSVSTNNPCPRSVRANRRIRKQSVALHKQRLQSSVNAQRQRTRIVRRQSAAVNNPRSQTGHGRNLSATVDRQRLIRVTGLSCPHGCRPISRFSSKSFRPMNTFDPVEVRKAVAEFTPRRPQKFQDLVPAKEVIVELRQKGGSYRSIAELLTQHCLPTSKTAIAMFCHQVLGENIRPRKRPARKRPPDSVRANGEWQQHGFNACGRIQHTGRTSAKFRRR